MTVYRTGNHHGITIVTEGDGTRCGRPDHDCQRGHLAAVVVNGDQALADRICALLNADAAYPHRCPACGNRFRTRDAAASCDLDHRAHANRTGGRNP